MFGRCREPRARWRPAPTEPHRAPATTRRPELSANRRVRNLAEPDVRVSERNCRDPQPVLTRTGHFTEEPRARWRPAPTEPHRAPATTRRPELSANRRVRNLAEPDVRVSERNCRDPQPVLPRTGHSTEEPRATWRPAPTEPHRAPATTRRPELSANRR